jgi:hypothetical protein
VTKKRSKKRKTKEKRRQKRKERRKQRQHLEFLRQRSKQSKDHQALFRQLQSQLLLKKIPPVVALVAPLASKKTFKDVIFEYGYPVEGHHYRPSDEFSDDDDDASIILQLR